MILPFSTNVWNALRFILLSLVVVPVIENALHRLHQMRTAHRLLSSKPARIRQSKIGNWGLHQEVDELNFSSKVLAVVVAVLYVGLSLYTEYASGSQQVTRTRIWQAPVSKNIIQQGNTKFYDTNLVAYGSSAGCMSKASRMAIHKLSEDIVECKIQRLPDVLFNVSWPDFSSFLGHHGYKGNFAEMVKISYNDTHLLLTVTAKKYDLAAVIDDEKVCLGEASYLVCFSKCEKITVLAAIGNLLYFQDVLIRYAVKHAREANTVPLLSNDAFTSNGEFLARTYTRTEFMERVKHTSLRMFHIRFKYETSGVGKICDENRQLQPKILRLPQSAHLIRHEKRQKIWLRLNRTAKCIGLFWNNLLPFDEFANSTMVCYTMNVPWFCAQKRSDGSFSLSKLKSVSDYTQTGSVEWTLEFRDEGLGLGDVARGAMVLFKMSREVDSERHIGYSSSEVTKKFAEHLRNGIPKLTQVGGPNSTYFEVMGKGERATVVTWVLLLWVVAFFLSLTYICCTNMMRSRLLPDVDFLYRRAVMQQHTRHNSVKSIRNPPTVSISKTGKFGEFSISYDAVATAKIAPGDLLM